MVCEPTYNGFSANVASFYNSVSEDLDTVIVNKDGTEGVVLMSVGEYNSLMETVHLMSSPETMADIRQAEADIKAGKGIEVNLEDL